MSSRRLDRLLAVGVGRRPRLGRRGGRFQRNRPLRSCRSLVSRRSSRETLVRGTGETRSSGLRPALKSSLTSVNALRSALHVRHGRHRQALPNSCLNRAKSTGPCRTTLPAMNLAHSWRRTAPIRDAGGPHVRSATGPRSDRESFHNAGALFMRRGFLGGLRRVDDATRLRDRCPVPIDIGPAGTSTRFDPLPGRGPALQGRIVA